MSDAYRRLAAKPEVVQDVIRESVVALAQIEGDPYPDWESLVTDALDSWDLVMRSFPDSDEEEDAPKILEMVLAEGFRTFRKLKQAATS